MKEGFDTTNCFTVEGKLALPYTYFAGRVGSKFLTTIRDQKKILGVKCNTCNKVLVPPRQNCNLCLEDVRNNWVELADTGKVTNFTVVRYKDRHLPKDPPYVLAAIQLDGADSSLIHIVEGLKADAVKIGLKVKAVFAKDSTGTILDIDHFEPA